MLLQQPAVTCCRLLLFLIANLVLGASHVGISAYVGGSGLLAVPRHSLGVPGIRVLLVAVMASVRG